MHKEVFDIGLTLSLETYYKTYHTTQVLGWEKDSFVLTKAIYVQGKAVELLSNDTCKIRLLKDGVACGFESKVIAVQFYPFPLMFIKYPNKIETLNLRVAPRFKIEFPAKFLDAAGALIAGAVLIDISEGGCGLRVPIQKGKELSPEAGYSIALTFMNKEISVGCAVRRLAKDGESYLLGIQFTNVTAHNKETLSMLLDFHKKHAST